MPQTALLSDTCIASICVTVIPRLLWLFLFVPYHFTVNLNTHPYRQIRSTLKAVRWFYEKENISFFKEIKKTVSGLWFMLRYSWCIGKSTFFLIPFTIVINSALPLCLLALPKYIIDELTYARRYDKVLIYILILTVVSAFAAIYKWGVCYFQNKLERKLELKNEKEYIHAVLPIL